jgi:Ribbon-helix-helix protein, copG family
MAGGRAGQAQYAERVNAAADLVGQGSSTVDAAGVLAARFGVSVRQARRYVDQATVTGRRVVPPEGVVFTVRLPAPLAARVRRRAASSGVTISALVTRALTEFLSQGRAPGPRG